MLRILPINKDPGFATECYHNVRLSIVLSKPERRPWFWSHFVSLIPEMEVPGQFPIIRFEDHLDVYTGLLSETALKDKDLKNGATAFIRSALLKGRYVLLFVNWKFVRSSNLYGSHGDVIHEALVYGYDDAQRILHLLAFEVNGENYGSITLKYDECERLFAQMMEHHLQTHKWFALYGFPLGVIEETEASTSQFEYGRLFFALERARNRQSAQSQSADEYFSEYFARYHHEGGLDKEKYSLWNIMTYKGILQKSLMLERLDYFKRQEEESKLLDIVIATSKEARSLMLTVKGLSYKYQKMADRDLLGRISDCYRKLFEMEKRVVPLLMEFLVESRIRFGAAR